MKHIITGGSGFVASALRSILAARGEDVILFDSRSPTGSPLSPREVFFLGDIREKRDLQKLPIDPDTVFYHLAARQFADNVPSTGRDKWFAEVNVGGTRNLIETM